MSSSALFPRKMRRAAERNHCLLRSLSARFMQRFNRYTILLKPARTMTNCRAIDVFDADAMLLLLLLLPLPLLLLPLCCCYMLLLLLLPLMMLGCCCCCLLLLPLLLLPLLLPLLLLLLPLPGKLHAATGLDHVGAAPDARPRFSIDLGDRRCFCIDGTIEPPPLP